jgi:hypothetical protein
MKQIYCGKPQNSGYQGWELCKVVGVTGKEPWVQSTIPYLKKKVLRPRTTESTIFPQQNT